MPRGIPWPGIGQTLKALGKLSDHRWRPSSLLRSKDFGRLLESSPYVTEHGQLNSSEVVVVAKYLDDPDAAIDRCAPAGCEHDSCRAGITCGNE
jgi:hypothetical protein